MTSPEPFYKKEMVHAATWQGLERTVLRMLRLRGFEYVWLVGQSNDGGADVIATRRSQSGGEDIRWLVQVKKLRRQVGEDVVNETLAAAVKYGANVPVIVSSQGFTESAYARRDLLHAEKIPLQLWDAHKIELEGRKLEKNGEHAQSRGAITLKPYQATAVDRILERFVDRTSNSALVVLATGLGKTVAAAEAVRRMRAVSNGPTRVLVIAHTIPLVHQLERSFWAFMSPNDSTCVLGGNERPNSMNELERYSYVFATRDTLHPLQESGEFPNDIFDIVVVDECHHLGSTTYDSVLAELNAGREGGPFLIGLTATPWRPSGEGLHQYFADPVVSVDLPTGLKAGFLANVDYRIFTDNVDWERLREEEGERFTPEKINRTLFITNWDDSVIERTSEVWQTELKGRGRGLVFCGTIQHAQMVSQKINALGFTNAAVLASHDPSGRAVKPVEKSRLLWDFAAGKIGILCTVDVLNEGVDVPDVNLVVFQRVTHSRRIFVQQLGRGLRVAPGKEKVIVLDFVTDIRRFAEGLALERGLQEDGPRPGDARVVTLPSRVTFMRATKDDFDSKEFLTHWLKDMEAAVADADGDASILSFPDLKHLPKSDSRARRED